MTYMHLNLVTGTLLPPVGGCLFIPCTERYKHVSQGPENKPGLPFTLFGYLNVVFLNLLLFRENMPGCFPCGHMLPYLLTHSL